MKTVEKIAIDAIIMQFAERNIEIIRSSISSRIALQQASQNHEKNVSSLLVMAKKAVDPLINDNISEDAIKYLEERMSAIINMPFSNALLEIQKNRS